ncbi:SMP-30/gluconolactonase/LRE family protein [soil metagenome]
MAVRTLPAPRILVDAKAHLGEGPVWDDRIGCLVWLDIRGRTLYATDPTDGATRSILLPSAVGVAVPRASGGYVAALEDGFWAVSDDGAVEPIAAVGADDPRTRFNDGACDPQGRMWAGTMAWDEEEGAGSLYRLDPDGSVHRVIEGVTISNGLGWSPDGRTMYYVDTPTRRIDAFDFDGASGDISNRRQFVELEGEGFPDGLCVDVEGAVWLATWSGWAVRRYLPDGELEAILPLPCSNVSSCAFGGPDLEDPFITTAWEHLEPAERDAQPLAGGLFQARVGVAGLPSGSFNG